MFVLFSFFQQLFQVIKLQQVKIEILKAFMRNEQEKNKKETSQLSVRIAYIRRVLLKKK